MFASLKAGLIGASLTSVVTALTFALPGAETGVDFLGVLGVAIFVFFIGLFVGTIAIALCLTLFGLPIALLARNSLATAGGSAIALGSAVMLSALVALLLGGAEAILLVLPFSIPAAILFRREILLERSLP